MTFFELLDDIGWFEWIFYTFIIFIAFCFIFNKEISYGFNVNEHYHSPLLSSIWYAIFIPDKFLKENSSYFNRTSARQLEMFLNGLESGVVELVRTENECILYEVSKQRRFPLKFYISEYESNGVLLDGSSIVLPPNTLIQVMRLWYDTKKTVQKNKKKTLLT